MKKCQNCVTVIAVLIIFVIIIGTYGTILRLFFKDKIVMKDFMNYKVFKMGDNCCSLWPISHFALYAILAFIFPNCLLILFLIGVLWELLEATGDNIISRFSKGKKSTQTQYSSNWVEGNGKDIVFNVAGLFVGYTLRRLYDKNKKINK